MSDYTETFTKVDGNDIEAADFETEFDSIATAIATKWDNDAGTHTLNAAGTLDVSAGTLTLADDQIAGAKVAAATTTTEGSIELATDAEALAGSDTTRALTSAGLASGATLTANDGSYELPGGLIIKWGNFTGATSGTETFAVAFPTACFQVVTNNPNGTPANAHFVTGALSAANFAWTSTGSGGTCRYLAIGN